jgi:ABC-2 type transport system permease protein
MYNALASLSILLLYNLGFIAVLLIALVPLAIFRPAAFAIFKRNLVGYFSNPTGYAFLCVFLAATSFALFWTDAFFANNLANLDQLNTSFPYIMLFFIPSITMSIWADERRQGTDELLLTLPAEDLDIVLGKYVAAAGTLTVALLVSEVATFSFLGLLANGDVDTGLFFVTYMGYWLMGLAMLALGMIASFLTTNLTVAFILGAIFNASLVFLVYVNVILTPRMQPHLFSRWSLSERFDDLGRGVLSLSSLIYFVLIVALGVYLSVILVGRRHWMGGRDGQSMLGHYLVRALSLVLILIGANVLFSNHDLIRKDLTSEQVSSLSPDTRDILAKLENKHPVRIEAFISARVPDEFVKVKYSLVSMLKELERNSGGKVVLQLNDNLEEFSKEAALAEDRYGVRRMAVETVSRGESRTQEFILGAAFTCGVEKVVVPFFNKGMPVEYELVRSIATVAQPKRRKLAIINTDVNLSGGFSFAGGQIQQLPKQAILEELEREFTVEAVDISTALAVYDDEGNLKFDAMFVVQPSSLSPPQLNNLVEAMKAGQPTVILEDPMPLMFQVVGTAEDKPAQGGMMGMGGPPQPKGDSFAMVWRTLGIEPLAEVQVGQLPGKIVCQGYMPYKRFGNIPPWGPFVFIRPGDAGTFNSKEPAVKNFEEVFFPVTGGIREAANIKDLKLKFTPLVETDDNRKETGLVSVEDARQYFRTQDMAPIFSKMEVTPRHAYTLAAWIRGEAAATTDDDKKDAKNVAKKDGKADDKAKKPAVKKPLSVIYVADIDLISNQLLGMRTGGVEQFRWDNGPFILNLVDAVAGEDRYLDIRQRKTRYATLRRIEAEAQVAYDKEEEARKAAQKDYDEAVTKEDEAIKKIEKEAADLEAEYKRRQDKGEQIDSGEVQAKQQMLMQRLVTAKVSSEETKRNLKLDLEKTNDKIRRDRLQAVARIQNLYKLFSLLIPPLIPLCVGGIVWVRRYIREREGISKTRMKT